MVVYLVHTCRLKPSLHYRKRKMTDPSIYLVNIRHNTKELNELLADAQTPTNVRLAEILVVSQEIQDDAAKLKAWAIDQNLKGIE